MVYYKENTVVFIMPVLGNFIQDIDKNDPQSNINFDTVKKSRCETSRKFEFSPRSIFHQKLNQFYKS